MRKFLVVLIVLALTPALSFAQTVKAKEGVTIEISGSAKFTTYYRDDVIGQWLQRDITTEANTDSDDGTVFLGTLNFLIPNLDNKVSAGFQISSIPVEHGFVGNRVTGVFGQNDVGDVAGFLDIIALELNQIWVKASGFLRENWDLTIGKFRFAYDPVGDGNEFFISLLNDGDYDGAESAFMTPFAENIADPTYAGAAVDDWATSPFLGFLPVYRGAVSPGGFLFEIKSTDQLSWDIFYFNIAERVDVLYSDPFYGAGSSEHQDETLWGLHVDYRFGNNSQNVLFGTLANIANFNYNNDIWTIGGGLVYNYNGWRFYGEVYYQWGDYGEIDQDNGERLLVGVIPGARDIDIDHSSWALNLGVQYSWNTEYKPYLGLGYTFVEGDDGEMDDDDPENNDFVSYEDNDSTMILEENLLGLDVDSNYHKVQAYGGFQTKLIDRPLHLKALLAWAELDEEPDRVGRAATAGDIDVDEDLGTELDVTLKWDYSNHLTFTLGLAFLWGADFLDSTLDDESTTAYDPVADERRRVTEDDDTFLITLDTKLKF